MAKKSKTNIPWPKVAKFALIGGSAYVGLKILGGRKPQANGGGGGGIYGMPESQGGLMDGILSYLDELTNRVIGIEDWGTGIVDPAIDYTINLSESAYEQAGYAKQQANLATGIATGAGVAAVGTGAYTVYKTTRQTKTINTLQTDLADAQKAANVAEQPRVTYNYVQSPDTLRSGSTIIDSVPTSGTRSFSKYLDAATAFGRSL